MKTIFENESTPKKDGYRMPGEFEPQTGIWMLWPHRPDNWRNGAKPAQAAFANVAKAIAQFEPVTVGVNPEDYATARYVLGDIDDVRVIEMTSDDSWIRDCGPTFVVNDAGDVRAVHWHFNAWGGLVDGLYFPWDQDELVGVKVADLAGVDRYRPDEFILEGGSIHVDGEGSVITTEMCLLSEGRNPQMTREQVENYLGEYLGVEKVIWVTDGIDPEETNGHIDDVACYVAPGEVACIWTEDEDNPFYAASHAAYDQLSSAVDAQGRTLKVHKLCMPKNPTYMTQGEVDAIDVVEGTLPRTTADVCIASYMNFLIVNGGVIVPRYDDENDNLALEQVQAMFPDRKVVGVSTREVVYGGGNIHCITQQQPSGR
ncbi:MAG: agmatine deiminase [Raoultibacter sp.]